MKKTVMLFMLLMLQVSLAHSATVSLDFSSGIYNGSNTIYEEDGFIVEASHGFHVIRLDTLAWSDSDNVITISSKGGLFDLDNLTIANRAFVGLVFESSNGGSLSVGSISGLLAFTGEEWNSIEYFTVTTKYHHFDILNQLDNITLTTVPVDNTTLTAVPLPPSASLMLSALIFLCLSKYITRRSSAVGCGEVRTASFAIDAHHCLQRIL